MTDATQAAALPIAPGQLIAERYLVGEVLGEGGMGVVCAGTHVLLGTPVAIKLIHSDLKHNAEAVQRFVNEARATAALKGEHIARVFDVGVLDSGEPYLVMEQLEGTGLDQFLAERGPLTQAEAVDIVLQACEGLAEAHAAALVHRDIKPANLFLARQPTGQFSLKILDFGIAKQRIDDDTPGLTNPGKSLGSPWYMSPEQMLTPANVDERADVWSLGVLLFELLVGKRPFDGESVPQVCATVLTAPAPRLSDYRADVAPELDLIVWRCLEKEPSRRLPSVAELAQALVPFASAPSHGSGIALDETSGDPAASAAPRPAPSYGSLIPLAGSGWPARRRRSWPRTVALFVVPLVLLGAWFGYRDRTLLSRALNAAHVSLPWDPRLGPDALVIPLERSTHPPLLLQKLQTALAVPQRMAAQPPLPTDESALSPEEREQRAANYEAWLRAQGLKRIESEL